MLHPNIEVVENEVIHGKGLVAVGPIRKGEIVSRLEPDQPTYLISDVLTWSQEDQDKLLHYGYQYREDKIIEEQGVEKYMNHSCDPNTMWLDDDTMIASRDIEPGEEITFDYATTEITIPFEMQCRCGAAKCRGLVTNLDHLNEAWQARYGEYLPAHTRKAIAEAKKQQG